MLVWAIAIGMFLLVLWRLLEAFVGHRDKDEGADRWKARAVSGLKAVIYAAVGITRAQRGHALGFVRGGSTWTQTVMDWPAGQWIIAAGRARGDRATAPTTCGEGFTEKLRQAPLRRGQVRRRPARPTCMFGKVGYIGKGIAIAIVGGLILYGGITHDASKSGSLDQALHKVLTYPFGQFLLVIIAAGLICYGLFCFARARHLSKQ